MIGIELIVKAKNGLANTFLINVVGQKIKRIHDGEKSLLDSKWWPYQEILGQGKEGESLTVVYKDGKTTKSHPVVSYSFIKLK